ncbi:MAG: recombination mediator RecR [Patescibacteria group bacterium]|jgi:recombination protein RecR
MSESNIKNLVDKFARFPSIGPKTAERMVYYLLRQSPEKMDELSSAIHQLKNSITACNICFNFSESNPCPICSDLRRDRRIICIVAKPQDISAIEKTGSYNGVYHVLGGNINPLENIMPENLRLKELLARIKDNEACELILALNQDMIGETTALYLSKLLKQFSQVTVTRLARGLPMGADLEYADEVTLESAISGRREL